MKSKKMLISLIILAGVIAFLSYYQAGNAPHEPAHDAIQENSVAEQRTANALSLPDVRVINNDADIVQCAPVEKSEALQAEALFFEILGQMTKSANAERQLTSILLNYRQSVAQRIEHLVAFNRAFPGVPDALHEIVALCTLQPESEHCSPGLMKSVEKAVGDDGRTWLEMAGYYLAKENEIALKRTLRMMPNTDSFSSSYGHYMHRTLYGIKGSDSLTMGDKLEIGIVAWAERVPASGALSRWCSDNARKRDIESLCYDFAAELGNRAKEKITQLNALSLQETLLRGRGDKEAADLVANTRQRLKTVSKAQLKALNLMRFDKSLLQHWVTSLNEVGETKALQMLVEEAVLLSQNPYFAPCPK